MLPAIQHNLFVLIANKQINPVNYRKTDKVKAFLIMKLVTGAHELNILKAA
jgi:hypothetical protein